MAKKTAPEVLISRGSDPIRHLFVISGLDTTILSTVVGIGLDFANINPVKALFWTAVINGLLAPFLLIGILLVASDDKIMKHQPSSLLGRAVVGLTTLLMLGAALGMFVF